MPKLDLHLINCFKAGWMLIQDCRYGCDWYCRANDVSEPPGKITCGMTGEVLEIVHVPCNVEVDVDVLRHPETPQHLAEIEPDDWRL